MLIQSLKQHFPARFPEWYMSAVAVTWGGYILLHPEVFTQSATATVLAGLTSLSDKTGYPPAAIWGGGALVCGMLRAFALFVNGAYARTPIIRAVCSVASAFLFAEITLGLWRVGIPNTGLAVYGWLVIADLASAYRAGMDITFAETNRRQLLANLYGAGRWVG